MRFIIRGLTVAGALGLAALSLDAQGGPPGGPPGGRQARPARPDSQVRQIGPALEMRARMIRRGGAERGVELNRRQIRNRMVAQRAVARERIRNMTPEQRQTLQAGRAAMQAQRQAIGAEVRGGTLTREQARERMEAWRREHRPNAPLRGPKPPGGE